MQITLAVMLTVLYVGISLSLGGVPIRSGFPWWFFGPSIVMVCGGLIARWISALLPLPWESGRHHDSPPRRVHLSWRAAVRLPALLPMYLFPYYILSILRIHFDIGWALFIIVPIVVLALAIIARKRMREARLLREGRIAMAVVDGRCGSEWPDEITYYFQSREGALIRGRGNDLDYDVSAGASGPVYYAADNPRDHIVATACWFETDWE